MSDSSQPVAGQCLCGAIRFKAQLKSSEVGVCHCGMCRRWSGGTFMCVEFAGALDIDPGSQPHLGVFKSSDWGERGFCKDCGTSLFWRAQDGSMGVVSVQAIENLADPKLTHEIFIDDKPDYYSFAQDTAKMTGEQVFEMFQQKL